VPFFGRTTGLEKSISDDDKDFIFGAGGFSRMEFSFIKHFNCAVEIEHGQTFFRLESVRGDFRFAPAGQNG
jgi:hypothetical protein